MGAQVDIKPTDKPVIMFVAGPVSELSAIDNTGLLSPV